MEESKKSLQINRWMTVQVNGWNNLFFLGKKLCTIYNYETASLEFICIFIVLVKLKAGDRVFVRVTAPYERKVAKEYLTNNCLQEDLFLNRKNRAIILDNSSRKAKAKAPPDSNYLTRAQQILKLTCTCKEHSKTVQYSQFCSKVGDCNNTNS